MAASLPISSPFHLASTSRGQQRSPPLRPAASTGSDTDLSWASKDIASDTTVACAGQDPGLVEGNRWKPALCVILVELFNTGTILLSKVTLNGGMFVFSFLCYRSILGAIFILPFALFLESGKWKELDKKALGWLFTNTFAGYMLPNSLVNICTNIK